MRKILKLTALACVPLVAGLAFSQTGRSQSPSAAEIERGKYLTVITGCNDCHTPGYAESGGKTPVEQWLVGDKLGYRGPWGTTYPTNLRLYFQQVGEDQWAKIGKIFKTRPPMPWFSVNAMSEADLRAMHKFIRSLGPAGQAAPQPLPPGQKPNGPTIDWPGTK
jgi:mono/diheme cytochrome c family protein